MKWKAKRILSILCNPQVNWPRVTDLSVAIPSLKVFGMFTSWAAWPCVPINCNKNCKFLQRERPGDWSSLYLCGTPFESPPETWINWPSHSIVEWVKILGKQTMLPLEITGVLSRTGYVLTPLDMLCGLKILKSPKTKKKNWLIVNLGVEHNALSVRRDQPVFCCKDLKSLKRTIVAISAVMFAKTRLQTSESGVQNSAAVHLLCEPLLFSLPVQFISVFVAPPSDWNVSCSSQN